VVGARQRAAAEGHTQGSCAVICQDSDPHHLVERVAGFGGRTHHLEDDEIAGDSAALLDLGHGCTGDVISDEDGTGVDAIVVEALHRSREVHDVARIVAARDDDATTSTRRQGDRVRVLRGRRGEDVANDRAIREARADDAGESRIVAGAAPDDHGDLARSGLLSTDNAAGHADDVGGVCVKESDQHVFHEGGRIVE